MNNEDDFDWEAYEKAVREAPLCTQQSNVIA